MGAAAVWQSVATVGRSSSASAHLLSAPDVILMMPWLLSRSWACINTYVSVRGGEDMRSGRRMTWGGMVVTRSRGESRVLRHAAWPGVALGSLAQRGEPRAARPGLLGAAAVAWLSPAQTCMWYTLPIHGS